MNPYKELEDNSMVIILKFRGVRIQGSHTELSNLQKYVAHAKS